jgi:GT2 family glycosyltransferase
MPKLSVGILTYNRRDLVLKALVSVIEQGLTDVEIVVVDSASSDGTADTIATHYPAVKLIRLPRNLGCPGGRNHLFANCSGKYIFVLDDDGCLCDGTLGGVIEILDGQPDVGVVMTRRVQSRKDLPIRQEDKNLIEVGSFSGGMTAFRNEVLNKVGYYPEHFFLISEEAHLGLRIMNAGYRIVQAQNLFIEHPAEGGSTGDTTWDFYRYRNRLLVVLELFPGWICVKYLLIRMPGYLVLSIKRGTILKYLHAIADIVLHLPATMRRRKPVSRNAAVKYLQLRDKASL